MLVFYDEFIVLLFLLKFIDQHERKDYQNTMKRYQNMSIKVKSFIKIQEFKTLLRIFHPAFLSYRSTLQICHLNLFPSF